LKGGALKGSAGLAVEPFPQRDLGLDAFFLRCLSAFAGAIKKPNV